MHVHCKRAWREKVCQFLAKPSVAPKDEVSDDNGISPRCLDEHVAEIEETDDRSRLHADFTGASFGHCGTCV